MKRRTTNSICLLALGILIFAVLVVGSASAQDPIGGALATLSAATARAEYRQAARRATEQAQQWQAQQQATATARAEQASAQATQEARQATATERAVRAQATRSAQATTMAMDAIATEMARRITSEQAAERARVDRFASYVIIACCAIIAVIVGAALGAHNHTRNTCSPLGGGTIVDVEPRQILALSAPRAGRMGNVTICTDAGINARVEALFDQLEQNYGN